MALVKAKLKIAFSLLVGVCLMMGAVFCVKNDSAEFPDVFVHEDIQIGGR